MNTTDLNQDEENKKLTLQKGAIVFLVIVVVAIIALNVVSYFISST